MFGGPTLAFSDMWNGPTVPGGTETRPKNVTVMFTTKARLT